MFLKHTHGAVKKMDIVRQEWRWEAVRRLFGEGQMKKDGDRTGVIGNGER